MISSASDDHGWVRGWWAWCDELGMRLMMLSQGWEWWWWWWARDENDDDEPGMRMMMMSLWWEWWWWASDDDDEPGMRMMSMMWWTRDGMMRIMSQGWEWWWRARDESRCPGVAHVSRSGHTPPAHTGISSVITCTGQYGDHSCQETSHLRKKGLKNYFNDLNEGKTVNMNRV